MKKTKVENISKIKLELFLKQNKEDVRVTLNPGESSWCDHESTTKSMILYERKNLIKSSDEIIKDNISNTTEDLIPVIPLSEPSGMLFFLEPVYSESELSEFTQKKEIEEPKKESEKKYKGKKRGRKKKRGPKPGSKRNKGQNPQAPENPTQQ